MYILMDLERTIGTGRTFYWNQNRHGYTNDINEAGRFSLAEATMIVHDDRDERTIMIDEKVIEKILRL